jgi:serine/threonine-protein kinase
MTTNRQAIYEFGDFRLDARRRLLVRDDATVALTPKTFDLLLTLVQHRGQVLSKEELLRRIWPRTAVEASNLTQNIFVLRKTLGETPNDHNYIVTAPGHGYRFVAPVRELEPRAEQEWVEDLRAGTHQPVSIAVLPLKNINPQTEDAYLGTGLASSLINRLNRLSTIVARPATSVLKYTDPSYGPQQAGLELGVSAVLDGTIQRAGNAIRVNVEMIRVLDGITLWAGQFDNNFTDIFGTEDAIAEEVIRALELKLTSDDNRKLATKETENPEAYRLYIKGRFFWDQRTRNGFLKGIDYARRALALDPNYVRAHVGLADSYSLLGQYLHLAPADAFPQAKEAAVRALELDDSVAEAHASMAELLFFYEWDWAGAEASYQRAFELDPRYASARHWYAWFLMSQKRHHEALEQIRLAQRLDPGSLTLATTLGLPFYYQGQYEQAAEQYQEVLEMDPNFTLAHYYFATAMLQMGRYGEAIAYLRRVRAVDYSQQVSAQLGCAYARLGRRSEALNMLQDLKLMRQRYYVSPFTEAMIYASLNDTDAALERLAQAREERAPWMVFLQIEPCFETIRSDRRFRRLVQELWG